MTAARRIAFLFPGQGAQQVGMGRDLFGRDSIADHLASIASEELGADITRICTKGPSRILDRTVNLQPALAVLSLALAKRLQDAGVAPAAVAGHSAGEIPALAACGAIEAETAVKLAVERGRLMDRASSQKEGGPGGSMAAVSGMTATEVEDALKPFGNRGTLCLAAVNAPSQVTVSGDKAILRELIQILSRTAGVSVKRLAVSGAWHSDHMASAVAPFGAFLNDLKIRPGRAAMLFNADGGEAQSADEVRRRLAYQLRSPVRFDKVAARLFERGITDFVEIGPGRVLRGLVRLNQPEGRAAEMHSVSDLRSLERTLERLG